MGSGGSTANADPGLDPRQVSRAALCRQVLERPRSKVVAVSAPAGFGKTTVLSQMRAALTAAGVNAAWLSLDRSHNDVSHLISALVGTLRTLVQNASDRRHGLHPAAPPRVGMQPFDVLDQIGASASRCALILDDLETVQDTTALGLLRELVERKPSDLLLLIGSRRLPDLGLGRLRANEELVEFGTDDLRFSLAETREFFERRHALRTDEDLAKIHRMTEGWPAAINLASIAHADHHDRPGALPTLTSARGAIAQYLAEDVFLRQSPEIQDFLVRTGILSELHEPLCETLTGNARAGLLLEEIRRSNVFIGPTEPGSSTFRYHSLFADFLMRQLEQRIEPPERCDMHRTVAHWYLREGQTTKAIEHLLHANDHAQAACLIAVRAESLLDEGRMNMLAGWLQALPAEHQQHSGRLRIAAIWTTCFTRSPWEAMTLLEQTQSALGNDPPLQNELESIRASLLVMTDRVEEVELSCRASGKHSRLSFSEGLGASYMAYAYLVKGMHKESYAMIDAARSGARAADFRLTYTESMAGILTLTEGRLHEAVASFHAAMDATGREPQSSSSSDAWPGVLYAGALYQMNELDRAEKLLRVYVPLARDIGLADHLIAGYRMLSRIAFSRGDVEGAYDRLIALEHVGMHRQLPRIVSAAKLERARLHLMQGQVEASLDEFDRADDSRVWDRVARLQLPAHETECREIARCRFQIHTGSAHQALPMLRNCAVNAVQQKRHKRALKLRLLCALALQALGQHRQAHDEMRGVLAESHREGLIRVVIDEGPLARDLIAEIRKSGLARQESHAARVLASHVEALMKAFDPQEQAEAPLPSAVQPPPSVSLPGEPLTRKELRLLALLAEGHSNEELASMLFVSSSTVRTHLRHINAKLQTRSRTQAVAVARSLGLLK